MTHYIQLLVNRTPMLIFLGKEKFENAEEYRKQQTKQAFELP